MDQSERFQRARDALRQVEAQWRPDAGVAGGRLFSLSFGQDAINLPWSGLHQIEGPAGDAAATGFALTMVRQGMQRHGRGKPVFWITAPGSLDSGRLYPPALQQDQAARMIFIDAPRPREGFWAFEEILRSAQADAVIAELPPPDTVAGRRLQLAAEEGGSLAILLSLAGIGGAAAPPTPARSRWYVASRPGGTAVRLIRGQGLCPGEWRIDHDDAPVSLYLAATVGDRSLHPQTAA